MFLGTYVCVHCIHHVMFENHYLNNLPMLKYKRHYNMHSTMLRNTRRNKVKLLYLSTLPKFHLNSIALIAANMVLM